MGNCNSKFTREKREKREKRKCKHASITNLSLEEKQVKNKIRDK